MESRRRRRFVQFVKFSLIWYAQQFAIPFWIVGHVHLHFADYHAAVKALCSLLMHVGVGVGFWLDWREARDAKTEGGSS